MAVVWILLKVHWNRPGVVKMFQLNYIHTLPCPQLLIFMEGGKGNTTWPNLNCTRSSVNPSKASLLLLCSALLLGMSFFSFQMNLYTLVMTLFNGSSCRYKLWTGLETLRLSHRQCNKNILIVTFLYDISSPSPRPLCIILIVCILLSFKVFRQNLNFQHCMN